MALRYSIVAGAVGFMSGILYRERYSTNKCQVFAATNPSPDIYSMPMEVDDFENRVTTITKLGFPGFDNVRSRKSYVLSYDRRNRVPHWVMEYITPNDIKYDENVSRSKSDFFEDNSIHEYFRSSNEDYRRSGYDRGHLAAAGNHRSRQEFIDDTFVLSNITPQVGKGFNRDAWNKLEKHVRKRVNEYKGVYVCSGPLYLPRVEPDGKKYVKYEVIGKHDVAVPTHFFKVLVCERHNGAYDMEAYVMPNAVIDDNVPLKAFMVSRDVIERSAGLLLFNTLPNSSFNTINGKRVS